MIERAALVQAGSAASPRRNDLLPRLQLVDWSPHALRVPAAMAIGEITVAVLPRRALPAM